MQASWIRLANTSFEQATVVAAGSFAAISWAKFGPETTATCSALTLATSAITSVIRSAVPSSTPFMRETMTASLGIELLQEVKLLRSV